ncbi:hypothetical protein PINS_up012805 [Pythium insidiosum]|nr:hypothetical protein PINS_up012805 [Pythium insidiosum]
MRHELLSTLLTVSICLSLLVSLCVAGDGLDAVTALEAQCDRFSEAQNASLVLRWELLDGAATSTTVYTRISHTSVALSAPDRVLIIGGIEYESAQPVVVNTTLVYLAATDVFALPRDQILSSSSAAAAPPKTSIVDDVFVSPASRVEHAVFSFQNVVFLFGGQNKQFLGDAWRLCVTSDSATATWDELLVTVSDTTSRLAAPAPRVGHSFSLVFENASHIGAVVYGGLSESFTELDGLHLALITKSSALRCADRSPRVQWRVLNASTAGNPLPLPRAYHSASAVTQPPRSSPSKLACLIVFGGRNTQQNLLLGDLWRLCPAVDTSSASVEAQLYAWQQLEPVGGFSPGPRFGAALAFVNDGKLVLAGGSSSFPNDFLRDAWELNANATQWLALRFEQDFTPPRRGHSLTLLPPNRLYLFGGRDRYAVVSQRLQRTQYSHAVLRAGAQAHALHSDRDVRLRAVSRRFLPRERQHAPLSAVCSRELFDGGRQRLHRVSRGDLQRAHRAKQCSSVRSRALAALRPASWAPATPPRASRVHQEHSLRPTAR